METAIIVEGVITKGRKALVILSAIEGSDERKTLLELSLQEARSIAADLIQASHQIEDDLLMWNFLVDCKIVDPVTAERLMHSLSQYRSGDSLRSSESEEPKDEKEKVN